MCLEWLQNKIYNRNIPSPDIVGAIEYQELYSLLKAEFGMDVPIMLPDHYYELATMESFKKFLKQDSTDKYLYTGDLGFDCDNYARVLSGNTSIPKWATIPICTCWLSEPAHAVNIFVDENKIAHIVEPQTDSIFRIGDRSGWIARIIWI